MLIFILLILTFFIIWYKDRYKKLRRWQLSPSINRRGRDNYPAAVGLIASGATGDLDCDNELDDDTDIHDPL